MSIVIPADARPAGAGALAGVVEAFTAAVVTTFQELTSTAFNLRVPVLLTDSWRAGDINAIIDLKRSPPARLVCAFPLAVLDVLTHRYLPAGVPVTPAIVEDTAGEFANVIAGQAKTMLKGTPYHYMLSMPVVRRGPITPPAPETNRERLLFVFDSEMGSFSMSVELHLD